jgi:hypothetical protein
VSNLGHRRLWSLFLPYGFGEDFVSGDLDALRAIGGNGTNEFWAVGDYFTIRHTVNSRTQWDDFSGQQRVVPASTALRGLWVDSDSDVWVGSPDTGNVLRFDGTRWAAYAAPLAIHAISGSAPDDVWIGGRGGDGSNRDVAHFDGHSWERVASPYPPPRNFDDGSGVEHLWARGPGDLWALGRGGFYHYDGSAWTAVSPPGAPPELVGPIAAWPVAGNDVWASQVIYHGFDDDWDIFGSRISHFDGTSWSASDVEGVVAAALWAAAPDDVWMTGLHGGPAGSDRPAYIYHFDGSSWTRLATYDFPIWFGIAGRASDDVTFWNDSAVIHWDGSSFTTQQLPSDAAIREVGAVRDGGIWAIGGSAAVLRHP